MFLKANALPFPVRATAFSQRLCPFGQAARLLLILRICPLMDQQRKR